MTSERTFPCPSCGFLVFGEPPGSYDICPISGKTTMSSFASPRWEEARTDGASLSPNRQREAIARVPLEVARHDGYDRDPSWRPLTAADVGTTEGTPKTGMEYFQAAGEGSPRYYWRKR